MGSPMSTSRLTPDECPPAPPHEAILPPPQRLGMMLKKVIDAARRALDGIGEDQMNLPYILGQLARVRWYAKEARTYAILIVTPGEDDYAFDSDLFEQEEIEAAEKEVILRRIEGAKGGGA